MKKCLWVSFLLLASCGQDDVNSHDLKITNGREVSEDLASTVGWIDSDGVNCTGTFLTDSKMLTAAHCIQSTKIAYFGKSGTVFSTRIAKHPKWRDNGSSTIPVDMVKYDLAVVTFPNNTGPAKALIAQKLKTGDYVTIAGFGSNKWDGNSNSPSSGGGVFRVGENRITHVSDGVIFLNGKNSSPDSSGADAGAAKGDSGGPLFIQRTPFNKYSGIVGVASGAEPYQGNRLKNAYVDLNSSYSRSFLRSQGIALPSL
ncbi:trypsin-like serine protease [Pseudobacteriovorax antillogorgiicola]|uniref:Trypsin n=1 Tax=Pseudobacteriovorax antillogorgiicola TaxID=1513793 RepID=A0A1Y6BBQ9_9BACT|nr:trypsin-like serine protease [Pseudobacteriovorax antillogorgiicola]TCS58750.1 trypsin [Pseudobacteriovorax antillogorgiicola]SME95178.1 Trypsin [Pseudobacteriovorax antillogorgiicola]